MEIDQVKFMKAVIERSSSKINALQEQVIVLESQLHCALEINKQLEVQIDKLEKSSKTKTKTDSY